MSSKARVLVAGGGIGGLTAAVALARQGFEVRVFERAPALQALGAGITLQSNAISALRTLDLDTALVARGHVPRELAILDDRGRVLSRVDSTAVYEAVGAPTVGIHRAALQAVLLDAAGPVVDLGAAAVGYDLRADGVTLRLADGRSADGDVLVGADGLRSAVRAQLLGAEEPLYAGYTAWRGVTTMSGVGRASESWGRGRRFGIVPLGDRQVYWFCTANVPPGGADASPRDALLQAFGSWHAPIRELIATTPPAAIMRNDVLHRPPVTRWGQGRVTLLGDAAHPMTPDLGQGACQAIEDAVVLALCLAEADDVESGLRRYEQRRIPRANAVVRTAARLGWMAQWESPLACATRAALARATPAAVTRRQLVAALRFNV